MNAERIETQKEFDMKRIVCLISAICIVISCLTGCSSSSPVRNDYTAKMPSGSMENTIMTKDMVAGDYHAYDDRNPRRGEVIAFKFPDNENESFVKRIIGLPGETVHIKSGKIYINNSKKPLNEPYLREEWKEGNNFDKPFKVPKDSYFCLGDNRNVSNDARYWRNKYVKRGKITAKINKVVSPEKHRKEIKTPKY